MIEERQTRIDQRVATAVEVELHMHVRFFSLATSLGHSRAWTFYSALDFSHLHLITITVLGKNLTQRRYQFPVLLRCAYTHTEVLTQHRIAADIAHQNVALQQL